MRPLLCASLLALGAACHREDGPDPDSDHTTATPLPSRIEGALQGSPFSRWVFEVDAVAGRALSASTVEVIPVALDEVVDKPGGIEFVNDDILEGQLLWNESGLRELGEQTFDDDAGDDTYSVHLMLVNGTYTTAGALGLAWGHTHIVLFVDAISLACNEGPGDPERVCPLTERGVLTHEIGHVLGLVDNGLPMVQPHEDPEHPGHDVDEGCVMYWAYEGEGLVQHVRSQGASEPELGFDEACRADLTAGRETK